MTDIEKKIVEAGFVYTNPGTFQKKIKVDDMFYLTSYAVVAVNGPFVTISIYLGRHASTSASYCLCMKSAPPEEFSELMEEVFKVASEKFVAAAQKMLMISMTGSVEQ